VASGADAPRRSAGRSVFESHRPNDWPSEGIRDSIHPRRYALKNRERTNRLLMLMQLDANGDDSEPAYRKAILDWLLANGGRPRGVRRCITDPLGTPSLR
jgi:hypothetical protein